MPTPTMQAPATPAINLDHSGRHLAAFGVIDGRPTVRVFDLANQSATAGELVKVKR